jgi:alpha-N-arabinofuranosidase
MIVRHEGVTRSDKVTFGNFSFTDGFDGPELGDEWMTVRTPAEDRYSLTETPGFLKLFCSEEKATGVHTPAFVGHRLHHHKFSAETRMYFTPSKYSDAAGLLLFKDERHQYFFKVSKDGIAMHKVQFEILAENNKPLRWNEIPGDEASAKLKRCRFVDLKITSDGDTFSFWYAPNGKKWTPLIEGVDASYLSSARAGGFTGTLIGPYAVK